MQTSKDAKDRMVQSAMELQRRRGVPATALSDIIEHSGAPRGSIYHYFPDGRSELAAAATDLGADLVATKLRDLLAKEGYDGVLRGFYETWSKIVLESDYEAVGAVAAGALDPTKDSPARRVAADAFDQWQRILIDYFTPRMDSDSAGALAAMCVAAMEGALIMTRAQETTYPLKAVTELLAFLGRAHGLDDGGTAS